MVIVMLIYATLVLFMASSSSRRSPSPSRSSKHRSRRSVSPGHRRRRDRRSRSPRKRSRSRSPRRHRKRRSISRSDSRSHHRHSKSRRSYPSESSSDPSSSDSSEEYHKRKRREHKKHKKDRSHKKSKKKHKKSKLSSVGDQWGKYGIIHEADIFTKEAEFQAWLIEVKNVNVETIGNSKRKELFTGFMEDFNTATMPHEKFYNLHSWEKRQAALRMGEQPLPMSDTFDFKNDEEKLRMHHRQAARANASRQPMLQLSEEKIKELARVNRERIEADRMRKMGLTPKEGMGVRYEDD